MATQTKNKTLPKKRLKKPTPEKVEQVTHSTKEVVAKEAALHPVVPTLASVPDIKVFKKYISRSFDIGGGKTMTDMEILDYCYEKGINILIEGPTGPGKTMATRAWAASRGRRLVRIPSNTGIDPSQLFGRYIPDEENSGFVWVDGPVPHVFRFGGVILWNEINFTPERVGSVMFGALDDQREIILMDHKGEAIRAHRGAGECWCNLTDDECNERRVIIVADQNPGYSGTRDLNAALRNRFGMQLHWDYDANVEQKLVFSESLLKMAEKIRQQAQSSGFDTPVSTNMLMEFEGLAKDISVPFAIMNFVNHFKAEERDPIKLVCEAYSTSIINDYNPKPSVDEDFEDDEDGSSSDDNAFDSDVEDWLFTSDD